MFIWRSLIFSLVLLFSACEMASNAISSSASGFVSSQVDPIESGTQSAIGNTGSMAGSSAGGY